MKAPEETKSCGGVRFKEKTCRLSRSANNNVGGDFSSVNDSKCDRENEKLYGRRNPSQAYFVEKRKSENNFL